MSGAAYRIRVCYAPHAPTPYPQDMTRLLALTGLLLGSLTLAQTSAPAPSLSNNYRSPATTAQQTAALRTLSPYLRAGQITNWAQVLRTNVTRSQYGAYLEAAKVYYASIKPDQQMLMVYETLPDTSLFPTEEISGAQAQAYVTQGLLALEAAKLPAGLSASGAPIMASPRAAQAAAAAALSAAPITTSTTNALTPPTTPQQLITSTSPQPTDTVQVWNASATPTTAPNTEAPITINGPATARLVLVRPLLDAGLITLQPSGAKVVISRTDGVGGQSLVTPGQIGVKWRATTSEQWSPNRPTAGNPLPAMTRLSSGRLAIPDEAIEALGCAVVLAGQAVNVACGLQTALTERPLSAPLTPQQSSEVPSPLRR